ncbi:hypothetical protein HGRIS_011601 [Hohenbuehelia grisea]|uniref:GPI transamidase component PIG-S n=1 Tax=Hohenbuehelia grisea TaxID=104357 RepID=A0ABR3JXT8_9AGAR
MPTGRDPETERDGLRDPSQLYFQADHVRRTIIAAYWIIIFLAVPLWWHTTSIERLPLPSALVESQAERELQFPIRLQVPESHAVILPRLQGLLREKTLGHPERWKGLDLQLSVSGSAPTETEAYKLSHRLGESLIDKRQFIHDLSIEQMPELSALLCDLLAPPPTHGNLVFQYSPRYRLAFSLLNEDSASGGYVRTWNITAGISRHISPILSRMSVLHNFTLESQVQFHAPLAFEPRSIPDGEYGLSQEDLTVFVNSAEWTLSSSVSNDAVIHFVIFAPSAKRRPLRILGSDGAPLSSNSFLLPQWGGIYILNAPSSMESSRDLSSVDLDSIFPTFSEQLITLLGIPRLPSSVQVRHANARNVISEWQLDALMRRRTLENTHGSQDTLRSIVRLVDQIENMPFGASVRGDIQNSLAALEKAYAEASTSLSHALTSSAEALTMASRAFFDPGMLALLYFPAEHKYAVYMPLFASAVVPLIATALREFMAWKRQRRGIAGGQAPPIEAAPARG